MDAASIIDRHVEMVEGEPIRWGRDDCAMWAAAVLRDLHGVDLGRGWRRRYRSETGAARVLRETNLLRSVHAATRKAGWVRRAPEYARPGDLGIISAATGDLACVVCLRGGADQWWAGRINHGATYARITPRYVWGPNG